LATPRDVLRVWITEVFVGAINGIALGALIAAVALLWKGNIYLGFVVGAAPALNTLVAVSIGGTLPLLLKRIKVDPALASGPILTTVTDMCGFFFILSLASILLPKLVG
jgi:magnesium transporter